MHERRPSSFGGPGPKLQRVTSLGKAHDASNRRASHRRVRRRRHRPALAPDPERAYDRGRAFRARALGRTRCDRVPRLSRDDLRRSHRRYVRVLERLARRRRRQVHGGRRGRLPSTFRSVGNLLRPLAIEGTVAIAPARPIVMPYALAIAGGIAMVALSNSIAPFLRLPL